MEKANRKILLLVDNARSHAFQQENYPNVRIEFLEPNMTSRIQPLDAGVIRAFKAHYWQFYIRVVLQQAESNKENIYKIDQLCGM